MLLDVSLVSFQLLSLPHSSHEGYTKQPQRTARSFEKSEVLCMLRLHDPSSTFPGEGSGPHTRPYKRVGTRMFTQAGTRTDSSSSPSEHAMDLEEKYQFEDRMLQFVPCPPPALFKRALSTVHHTNGCRLVTSYLAGIATACSEREAELLLFHNICLGAPPGVVGSGPSRGGQNSQVRIFFLSQWDF